MMLNSNQCLLFHASTIIILFNSPVIASVGNILDFCFGPVQFPVIEDIGCRSDSRLFLTAGELTENKRHVFCSDIGIHYNFVHVQLPATDIHKKG